MLDQKITVISVFCIKGQNMFAPLHRKSHMRHILRPVPTTTIIMLEPHRVKWRIGLTKRESWSGATTVVPNTYSFILF